MVSIKLDIQKIQSISLFQKIVGVAVKDSFELKGKLYFIVPEELIGKAIGKAGSNLQKLETVFKRRVKVVGYSQDLHRFIGNIIYPLRISSIQEENGDIILTPIDNRARQLIIGKTGDNLKVYKEIINKYFKIKNLRVGRAYENSYSTL